jgi:hypothetical protein
LYCGCSKDVCVIILSTNSNFYNGNIHLLRQKNIKSHHSQESEVWCHVILCLP